MLIKYNIHFYIPVPGSLPDDAIALLIFSFFIKFQPEFLTEKGAELLLGFFNILLAALKSDYRFPKKLTTFKVHSKVNLFLLKDVEEYAVCIHCHTHFLWKTKSFEVETSPPSQCTKCKIISRSIDLFKNETRTISVRSFFYRSIIGAIQDLFFRPGFDLMLKQQKKRAGVPGYLGDIADGEVWKTFRIANDQPIFTKESHRNLMLSLNVDWLQPMDHTTHSTGAVYITIQNIPREQRMLLKHCILVSIISGPDEPHKEAIRFYFERLRDELESFIDGHEMFIWGRKEKKIVKAALTQIACDNPAAKKTIGMTSHSAGHCCHRCDNNFLKGPVFLTTHSLELCTERDMASHRKRANEWLDAPNKTQREVLASATGCRYSPLLDLPYMDIHRFTTFDPMHGLFLVSKSCYFLNRTVFNNSSYKSFKGNGQAFYRDLDW